MVSYNPTGDGMTVQLCRGETCGPASQPVAVAVRRHVTERALSDRVEISEVSCLSSCPLGPNVLVQRRRAGQVDTQALAVVLRGGEHPDACLVHRARAEEIGAMIDWFVRAWDLG